MHTEVISGTGRALARGPSRGGRGRGAVGRVPWPPGWMRTSRAGRRRGSGGRPGRGSSHRRRPPRRRTGRRRPSRPRGGAGSSTRGPPRGRRRPAPRRRRRAAARCADAAPTACGRSLGGGRWRDWVSHGSLLWAIVGWGAMAPERDRSCVAGPVGVAPVKVPGSHGYGRARRGVRSARAGRPRASSARTWPSLLDGARARVGRQPGGPRRTGRRQVSPARGARRQRASGGHACCAPRASRSRRRWRSRPCTGCCSR